MTNRATASLGRDGSPAERRAALRRMLAEPDVLVLPGVYDALSATLAQRSGFRGAYMTGAGVSMALIGHPDLGFTTLTEMAGQVGPHHVRARRAARRRCRHRLRQPVERATDRRRVPAGRRRRHAPRGPGVPEALRPPRRQDRHPDGRVRREDPRRRRGPHRPRPRADRPDRLAGPARLRRGRRAVEPLRRRRRRSHLPRGAAVARRDRPHPEGGRRARHVQLGDRRPLARGRARAAAGVGLRDGDHPGPPHRHRRQGDDPGARQGRRADADVRRPAQPRRPLRHRRPHRLARRGRPLRTTDGWPRPHPDRGGPDART